MAHNLAVINGRVAMAYQNETPWHKLGKRLHSITDVATALGAANLAWNVNLEPLLLLDGRTVPERKAVIRSIDGAILGTVGEQFRPIQNSEAFGVLDTACRDFGLTIESAGALGNGARTWMLAKLPTSIEPVPGDKINGYALIVNGHDGSLAYAFRPTPIRVVCQNTLNIALADKRADMIKLRHTTTVSDRLSAAKRMIERLMQAMKETGDTFAQLAERRMNIAEVSEYIDRVLPADDDGTVNDTIAQRRKTIASLVWCGAGASLAGSDTSGSTAWACYNAVVEYFDHVRPAEAQKETARVAANESALFGANAATKLWALQSARQLVAA